MTAGRSRRVGAGTFVDLVLGLAVGAVLLAILTAMVRPADGSLAARSAALDVEIRCPVCAGTSILDAPDSIAADMRGQVLSLLQGGATDDQVLAWFVQRYGAWIQLAPSPTGLALSLWLVPALVTVCGLLLVARRASAHGPRESAAPPVVPGRVARLVVVVGVVATLAVPLALNVQPREPGTQITGTNAAEASQPTLEELRAAVDHDPNDAQAFVALGDGDLREGLTDAAISAYQRALAIQPMSSAAALALGVVLLSAGKAPEAETLFSRVLAEVPGQPDALLYRALARFQQGASPDEIRADALAFLAVAGDDPRRTVAQQLLGLVAPTTTSSP
ncbi:MAG: cytochrome c-type biogenesis protein CcmH [Candidatus Limnocylindrales bacterium]